MKFKLLFLLFCTLLEANQQRIIALSPAINEILFALDKKDEIVGNTTYATYPKESQSITKVGGYFSISLEKIVMLRPTLVLMQKNNLLLKSKLKKLGIKTEVIYLSSLIDIKKGIKKIGTLTKTDTKAQMLIDDIDRAIKDIDGILKNRKILIVFGEQFDLKKEIFVSGNSIYFADIIRASGNKNALKNTKTKQPMLSYEGIIKTNPDIIYILAHTVRDNKEVQKLIEPWLKLSITASKAKTIYLTTQKYASMPSHRVVNFIKDFKEILKDANAKLANQK